MSALCQTATSGEPPNNKMGRCARRRQGCWVDRPEQRSACFPEAQPCSGVVETSFKPDGLICKEKGEAAVAPIGPMPMSYFHLHDGASLLDDLPPFSANSAAKLLTRDEAWWIAVISRDCRTLSGGHRGEDETTH
jgi:hypothetical protein